MSVDLRHILNWPNDAYYQFALKEGILWAWSHEYATSLLNYIESIDRNFEEHSHYLFLKHIPTKFLEKKGERERVSQTIKKTLAGLTKA